MQTKMEEFSNHLTEVLPILVFVTSKEASMAILTIETARLEKLNGGGEANPPQVVIIDSEEQPTPLYDFWFWTNGCDLLEVITGALDERGRCNSELLRANNNRYKKGKLKSFKLNALKALVEQKIIHTGRLRGINPDKLLAIVEKQAVDLYTYLVHFYQYYGKCKFWSVPFQKFIGLHFDLKISL